MRSMIEQVEPRTLMAAQLPPVSELVQAAGAVRAVVLADKASLVKTSASLLNDLKRLNVSSKDQALLTGLPKKLNSLSSTLTAKISSTNTKLVAGYRRLLADVVAVEKHSTTAKQNRLRNDLAALERVANVALPDFQQKFNTVTQTVDNSLLSIAALSANDAQLQQHAQDGIAAQNQASLNFTSAVRNWLDTAIVE